VFGPDRESFVDQIIARAQREAVCGAIADKFGSCSYSADNADQIGLLLVRPAAGILNLCNDGACSWLEFGQAALDIAGDLGLPLRCRSLHPLRLTEMKSFIAARPRHTAMDVTNLAAVTGRRPRPWREALRDYLTTYYQTGRRA
jgi:dTDP-4-dehydrorhamnose reductase